MRRKIKYLMPVMLACSMMQFSCSDWTDPESINIHIPFYGGTKSGTLCSIPGISQQL